MDFTNTNYKEIAKAFKEAFYSEEFLKLEFADKIVEAIKTELLPKESGFFLLKELGFLEKN